MFEIGARSHQNWYEYCHWITLSRLYFGGVGGKIAVDTRLSGLLARNKSCTCQALVSTDIAFGYLYDNFWRNDWRFAITTIPLRDKPLSQEFLVKIGWFFAWSVRL